MVPLLPPQLPYVQDNRCVWIPLRLQQDSAVLETACLHQPAGTHNTHTLTISFSHFVCLCAACAREHCGGTKETKAGDTLHNFNSRYRFLFDWETRDHALNICAGWGVTDFMICQTIWSPLNRSDSRKGDSFFLCPSQEWDCLVGVCNVTNTIYRYSCSSQNLVNLSSNSMVQVHFVATPSLYLFSRFCFDIPATSQKIQTRLIDCDWGWLGFPHPLAYSCLHASNANTSFVPTRHANCPQLGIVGKIWQKNLVVCGQRREASA